ncbi:MAG: hypothetical protein A2511_01055 [Deltaproteobacteria bacterium RIFOXYD12_FULL_50_9]|nr:MAG: hypothetical protein A2511_01055 [Deltaproteobacteria bacterium RIFOXYD12_FULL_50_9]
MEKPARKADTVNSLLKISDKSDWSDKSDKSDISHVLAILLILAAAIACYANTFDAPFHFDDFGNIVENPHIKIASLSLADLADAATKSPAKYRWLSNISFALNYYFGGYEVWGYHLVNLAIHIACGICIYFLVLLTLALPTLANRYQNKFYPALAAALIWLVHPVQTNGVTYIVQRMTAMSALFFLLSMLFYVLGRQQISQKSKALLFFTASGICGFFALISKENAAMLPIVLATYEWFFFRDLTQKSLSRALIYFSGAGLIFFFLGWLYMGTDPWSALINGYANRHFTLSERLLTESRVIVHYLTLLVLPLPSRLNLCYDFPLSHGILNPPQTLPAILIILAMPACVFLLYRRYRLPAFATLFFLVNLLIESSFIPLELVFEHRLYLPSIFLITATVAEASRLLTNHIRYLSTIFLLILLSSITLTWQRNQVWKSSISLWSDVVAKSPGYARSHENLGVAYSNVGKIDLAESELLRAIELDPDNSSSFMNLGVIYKVQGRINEAFAAQNKALTLKDVSLAGVHTNLGILQVIRGDLDSAIREFQEVLRYDPLFYSGYVNLGLAYRDKGRLLESEEYFRKAITLDPEVGPTYLKLAVILERQNRLKDAKQLLLVSLNKSDTDQAMVQKRLAIITQKLAGSR